MASGTTREEVAALAVDELSRAGIGFAAVLAVDHDEDGDQLELLASIGLDGQTVRDSGRFPVSIGGAVAEAVRTNAVVAFANGEDYDERFPAVAERRRRDGLETLVAAPLHGPAGDVVGALWIGSTQQSWLRGGRRALFGALAEQIGGALERARLDEALLARERNAILLARLTEALERGTDVRERAASAVSLLVDEVVDVAL